MNHEEQSGQPNAETQINGTESFMRLIIQRLVKDDFFVFISETAFITQMKQKILTFLKGEDLESYSQEVTVGDLRLIYKGKVLVDSESVQLYKIQNNDTIQLCPLRRKKMDQPLSNPAGGPIENDDARSHNDDGKEQHITGPSEVTFFSFSILGEHTLGDGRNLSGRNLRTRNQGPPNLESFSLTSQTRLTRRRRSIVPMIATPTPITTIGNLRNFKFVLQETLRRLSATNLNSCQELISQVDALIRGAFTLRGVLSEEVKNESPEVTRGTLINNPELRISHTGSIDVHSEVLVPNMLRYVPLRFDMESTSESPALTSTVVESSDSPGDTESARTTGETGNRPEQSRIFNNSQILAEQLQRNTVPRSIFNMLINQFNRNSTDDGLNGIMPYIRDTI